MDMSLSKLQESVMDREAWQYYSPWDRKELDTTEQLNWTELCHQEVLQIILICILLEFKKHCWFFKIPLQKMDLKM